MRAWVVPAAAAVAVLATGCGGGTNVPPLPEGRAIAASESITPRVHLYGDEVQARIDVLVDSEKYDPDRVRVAARFEPYELEGEVKRTERDLGRYTQLRYEYALRCVVYACLEEVAGGPPQVLEGGIPPPVETILGGFGERKSTVLKPARVVYDDPEKGTQSLRDVHWPELQSVSRLNYADTDVTGIGFPFQASVTPLHAASFRVDPTVLGAAFLLGAVGLLGLAAVLLAGLLRRDPEPIAMDAAPELTPLERALALVGWARERPEEERRESLEVLAVELETEGSELGNAARRLAWSSAAPSTGAIDVLVQSVRESDGFD